MKMSAMEGMNDLDISPTKVDLCLATYDAMVNEQNKDVEKSARELELKERLRPKQGRIQQSYNGGYEDD